MFANLSKKICLFLLLISICSEISFTKSSTIRKRKAVPTKKINRRNRYRRNAKTIRPHIDTPWKDLTEAQHIDLLEYARTVKNGELELKILLLLSKTAKQHTSLKKYLLELADFYFENKNLEKAVEYYQSYSSLYPGSVEAEYAAYKAVIASFYTTLLPYRDQTATEKTIDLASQFIRDATRSDYRDEAKEIIKNCTKKLFQHEVYIFDIYIKQKKFNPAQIRLDYIKKNFINSVKDINKIILHLEEVLKEAKDSKTRPFFTGVNFDLVDPSKTWSHQRRRINRIKF